MSTLWPCSECPGGWQTSQLWYSLDASPVLGNNQNRLQCLLWLGGNPCSMSGLSNLLPLRCVRQSASSVSEGGTTRCHPVNPCWSYSTALHSYLPSNQCAGVSTRSPVSEWSGFYLFIFFHTYLFVYFKRRRSRLSYNSPTMGIDKCHLTPKRR